MSLETTLLTVFTGIVAVALLLQSLAFWGIHRSIRNISSRIESLSQELQKKLDSVSASLNELLTTLKPVAETIRTMQQTLAATSDVIHKRVVDLDGFIQEFTDAARLQLIKIQDVLDGTSRRFEDTVETLQSGILSPITEITAILRGLKMGLNFFFRGRRPPSQQAHQNEEMFI